MADAIKKGFLSDEIVYQDASIVSKQIIKKPSGNITLFAFDKDETLTEHTSPFEAVVYLVDGEMEIRIGGNPYIVKAGEIIIMPPDIPHALLAIQKSKMLLTMIKWNELNMDWITIEMILDTLHTVSKPLYFVLNRVANKLFS